MKDVAIIIILFSILAEPRILGIFHCILNTFQNAVK